MKIKLDIKDLIENEKSSQERCLEFIGEGEFSIEYLEKMVESLKNVNESLAESCVTTTIITTAAYGGESVELEVPAITQSKLYKYNQLIIFALMSKIGIAKANKLEKVIDFSFTDEQILNYGKKENIVILK